MFMGWHVFQKARELNCTVMLNGQGSDEILLGYERYFTSTLNFNKPLVNWRLLIKIRIHVCLTKYFWLLRLF
jgi:asparagine synthetase B (glutamine-hydrolysing)